MWAVGSKRRIFCNRVLAENGFWHEIAAQGHSRSFIFHFAFSYWPIRGSDRVRFGRSRSFKVIQGRWFWYQSKARMRLPIIVINSNFGPILHRFWDKATYWLKIAYFFLPLSHSAPSLPRFPLEFRAEVNRAETRLVMGLSSSEDRMIVAGVVLTKCQRVTDRQTDGRADGRTDLR